MSFKSSMRSLAAAQRRAEREAKRRQCELERQHKELEKMEELERAQHEVEAYNNFLEVILSVHKDSGPNWDWHSIAKQPPPIKPVRTNSNEMRAKQDYESYEPNIADKLLRKTEEKKKKLELSIQKGFQDDNIKFETNTTNYKKAYHVWEEQKEIAKRIIDGDIEAYVEAIKSVGLFKELSDLGSSVEFSITLYQKNSSYNNILS